METEIWLEFVKLGAVVLLVLANGFFVAAEFALVGVRRTRIAELVEEGNVGARWVQKAIENPDRFIAATQLGITLASLGLGWIGEPALADLLEDGLEQHPGVRQRPGMGVPLMVRQGAGDQMGADAGLEVFADPFAAGFIFQLLRRDFAEALERAALRIQADHRRQAAVHEAGDRGGLRIGSQPRGIPGSFVFRPVQAPVGRAAIQGKCFYFLK